MLLHSKLWVIFIFCLNYTYAVAQQETTPPLNSNTEQQLENIAENKETETEDDSYVQQYQQLRSHPLNLNAVNESDLQAFLFLSPLQIRQYLRYRQLLGKLVSIYELQAVPGWELETIRKILPFVYVGSALSIKENLLKRLKKGDHVLLSRVALTLDKQNGFIAKDSGSPTYTGSPQRIFFRYKYQYKNLLQYGITGDKDAGESLFKGVHKTGFDFYSAHVFAHDLGIVKSLALGDFTVNLGQGLVSWQSLAFGKSADVVAIKRQAAVLRPYNSAGEFNFFRGAGITIEKNAWQATGFVSFKKISANAVVDSFSVDPVISSLQSSGYHRTATEIANKDQVGQFSFGGSIGYRKGSLQVGLNAAEHRLSAMLQKEAQPYNRLIAAGKSYTNTSMDYSYTFSNMHLFGEWATDAKGNLAIVNGILTSLSAQADASLLYRHISPAYKSVYTDAFTESTTPVNEYGLYAGLAIRPVYGISLNVYADVFSFPWLRYRVDRPSNGSEYLAQLTWKPDKQTELYTRYLYQDKAINLSNTGLAVHLTNNLPRQSWRTNFITRIHPEWTFKARSELVWLNVQEMKKETGFLLFTEMAYKPLSKPLAGSVRLQYFESDSYDSRLYAYETDVLYSFSIPPFFGKGYRWYLNLNYDINRKLTVWVRIAQSYYPDASAIGSGYDRIDKNHRTEIKLQMACHF